MKLKLWIPSVILIGIFCAFIDHNGRRITRDEKKTEWRKESKDKPLKICVISDLNSSYGSITYAEEVSAVMADLKHIKPDIILCGGDMVAGQKASLTEQNIRAMWQGFKETVLQPINQLNIPFGFTLGNHDASPSFSLDRNLAKQFWAEHAKSLHLTFVDSTHFPFYYSYIKNNVFFISWDAAGAQIKPEVLDWMKGQLKGKAATQARLRILMGHLPLYAIVESKNKPGEVLANADSTLNFMKEQGIDLYISGHQHAYYPARKNGLRLLNTGAIGDGPRRILGHPEEAKKAYTIIEVPVKSPRNFTYKTFMPLSNTPIDLKSLPDSVIGFNGVVKREDW